jgi:hypothetical protein
MTCLLETRQPLGPLPSSTCTKVQSELLFPSHSAQPSIMTWFSQSRQLLRLFFNWPAFQVTYLSAKTLNRLRQAIKYKKSRCSRKEGSTQRANYSVVSNYAPRAASEETVSPPIIRATWHSSLSSTHNSRTVTFRCSIMRTSLS